ncbi:MAG: hypothetical protein N2559_18085, partial [Anaerolineae bacterium]|nr:hypothetical protein [Anaerolineae bacterium]
TLKAKVKSDLAIGLGNVAYIQSIIGELKAAGENLRRSIEICREIKDEFGEAVWHQELGRVLAYRGLFAEAERELAISTAYWQQERHAQGQGVDYAYRALCALLMGDASAALAAARQAREFAEETARTLYPHERDFIRAEWLTGAALVAVALSSARRGEAFTKVDSKSNVTGSSANALSNNRDSANASPLHHAERHLQEALARDRAIGLVEVEAAILLEFARLRLAQAMTADHRPPTADASGGQPSAVGGRLQEAFDFAHEALEIAERCEYRLQQADIHNFLAEWWMAQA